GGARSEHRVHPRDDRRPGLRRLQVQPRHAGDPAAGLDFQTVRVFGGRAGGPPGDRDGRRLTAQPAGDPARLHAVAAERRRRYDARPHPHARRAIPVAQPRHYQARHGAGEQTVIGEARRYGITTPLPPYPSIHIGARGVRPIEMIAAYTAFATLGTRAEPVGVLRVEDRQGNILWQPAIRREPVMDPEHTWLMVDMMKDVIRRGTAFSAVWKAGFTLPAAGKTGTTDDYTDAWFIGYTPELVTGIWVGYDIQQRILEHNAGGGKIVAPAWTAFMRDVYDRRPAPPDWVRPDSLITREVDWSNGYLATPFCPQDVRHWDWFYPGTEPTQACPVHAPFGLGVSP